MKRFVLPIVIAAAGAGILASGAYGQGFPGQGFPGQGFPGHGFHGHGRSPAVMSCVAVMSQEQKAGLKQLLAGEKQTLTADRKSVHQARQALTQAILAGNKDVSAQESALSAAQRNFLKDRDALAIQVCAQLDSTQLGAAQTLHSNMTALFQNTHKQARAYLNAARTAAAK